MEYLSSRQNPIIKQIRALQQRKGRERMNRFSIEGVRLVEEALKATHQTKARFHLEVVLFSRTLCQHPRGQELIHRLSEQGVKMFTAAEELFPYLADTVSPQGIIGVVARTEFAAEPVRYSAVSAFKRLKSISPSPLLVVLDGVQDPGNLGTLIRTAEATGVTEVWLTPGTADPFSAKAVRASMGSIFRTSIRCQVAPALIYELGQAGMYLVAATVDQGQPYDQYDFCRPTVILLGNEGQGLSPFLAKKSQERITIPLYGEVESLNVAVAGAILLFEAQRQRRPAK